MQEEEVTQKHMFVSSLKMSCIEVVGLFTNSPATNVMPPNLLESAHNLPTLITIGAKEGQKCIHFTSRYESSMDVRF